MPSSTTLALAACALLASSACELALPALATDAADAAVDAEDIADARAADAPKDAAPPSDLSSFSAPPVQLERLARFDTTSKTFVDVPDTRLVPPGPATIDRARLLLVSARIGGKSLFEAVEARYRINGTEAGRAGTQNKAAYTAGPWLQFSLIPANQPLDEIDVQLRSPDGNGGAIMDLRLVLVELPETADAQYEAVDAEQTVTGVAWTAYQNLQITPREPGQYLLLGSAVPREDPASAHEIGVRFRNGGSNEMRPSVLGTATGCGGAFCNPRNTPQSVFGAWVERLSGPTTVAVECMAAASTAFVGQTRLLALRTDAWGAFHMQENLAVVNAGTTAPKTTSTLSLPAASAARALVVLQSSLGYGPVQRGLRYSAGQSVTAYDHQQDNNSYRVSYGQFSLLTDPAPTELTNEVMAIVAGDTVSARNSLIIAFGP